MKSTPEWVQGHPPETGIYWLAIDCEVFGDIALCWYFTEDDCPIEVLEHDGSLEEEHPRFPKGAAVAHWSEPIEQPPFDPKLWGLPRDLSGDV